MVFILKINRITTIFSDDKYIQVWCISKTNITFVPFKYRLKCLKMTFDVG